ncbi:MAG TPA: hypothetical protein VG325_16595 [Solirubrobacteraceae bacterium]|jgi:hypothetical protein|nr:hypothetical protein [Solirubrobacteraceae bacterium]
MIDSRFALLGALITIAGSASYARDTLRGRTQPNRVSWLLWTLAPLIAFAAELAQHVGLDSLLTFAVGFGPLLVVIASYLDPQAYWRLTRVDVACGCLSLGALVAWAVTGTGDIAIVFSILSDLFGGIPTLHKAYTHPASESASAFVASGCGATITLLTIHPGAWNFANFGFPLYILAADATLSILILFPRPRRVAEVAGDEPGR